MKKLNNKNINGIVQGGTSETIRENLKKFNDFYDFYNFSFWLVGFFEADGCFSINNRGEIRFELYQQTLDVQLLYNIKTYLQCGSVYSRNKSNSNTSTYSVQSIKHFKSIIYPIFNKKILSDVKFNQFKAICDLPSVNLPAIKGEHNNKAWLTGFIDGDGSFFVSSSQHLQILAYLSIGQKNPEVLNLINKYYFKNTLKVYSYDNIGLKKSSYSYLRISCKSISTIKNIITCPLLTRKSISFNNWLKVVEMIENKEHLTEYGQIKILNIKKSINNFKNMIESDPLSN